MQADLLLQFENILGEGPLWHPVHEILYWVDIEQKLVHSFDPLRRVHRQWTLPKRVGSLAPLRNGKIFLGMQGELAEMDPATGAVTSLVPLEKDLTENRCNDGKCDPSGRFWVGTMHLQCKPHAGSLYCVEPDLTMHKMLDSLTIANGMGWSPDGTQMYFIDSVEHAVRCYKFPPDSFSLVRKRTVLDFDNPDELPDGMSVDSKGNLWIGFWGGGRVGCYDPKTGEHLLDVKVPAPHVTSCCFGGPDLNTLFITTARDGLTQEQLQAYPLSGSVFSVRTNVSGLRAEFFGIPGTYQFTLTGA